MYGPEREIRIKIDVRMESAAVPLSTLMMIMKMSRTLTSLSRHGPYLHHHIEEDDLDVCPAAPYIEQVHKHYNICNTLLLCAMCGYNFVLCKKHIYHKQMHRIVEVPCLPLLCSNVTTLYL